MREFVVAQCERTMTSSPASDDSFKSEMRDGGARKTFKVDEGLRRGQQPVCRASLLSNAVMESEQDAGAITNAARARDRGVTFAWSGYFGYCNSDVQRRNAEKAGIKVTNVLSVEWLVSTFTPCKSLTQGFVFSLQI